MRAFSRPGRLIARVVLAGAALVLLAPSAAVAQDAPANRPGRVFGGGSLLGGDFVLLADRPVGIASGARVHAVRTPDYNRGVPARDSSTLLLTVGVRWQSPRGGGR